MVKLYIFVAILCFSEILTPIACEDDPNLQNILKLVEEIAKEVQEIVQDVSTSLPVIVKKLETNILNAVEELNVNGIFEELKEGIDDVSSEDSTHCAENALEGLEPLNQKVRSEMGECVEKAKESTENIKNKVQELMAEATDLAQQVSKKIEACLHTHGEEPAGLSSCLQQEIKSVKKLLKEMRKTIKFTVNLVKDLSKDIGSDLNECLVGAKEDVVNKGEKLIKHVKNCKNEL